MQYTALLLALAALAFSIGPVLSVPSAERTKRAAGGASLLASIRFMGHHRCSGAVIGETMVTTAAQCVQNANIDYLEVALGHTKDKLYQVSRVVVHPLYDPFDGDYNFAVLKVKPPIELGEQAAQIGLATNPLNETTSQAPVSVEWYNQKDGIHVQHTNAVSNEDCAAMCSVTSRMLCAEIDGQKVDTGAPLFYEGRLHGIFMKKVSRNNESEVGVYARVYPYVNSLLVDIMARDPVIDEVCKALRRIIDALENMPFIPSFIVSAVKYLASLLQC